jgi:hypothetical protein
MSEAMFSPDASTDYRKETVEIPSMTDVPSMTATEAVALPTLVQPVENEMMNDLLGSSSDAPQPPGELMGMMLDGIESVEYPTGSGTVWTRPSPDADWRLKP